MRSSYGTVSAGGQLKQPKNPARTRSSSRLRRSRILVYHAIDDVCDDPNVLNTTPERLREHMVYLAKRGLKGVSMARLDDATSRGEGQGLVGLTFDDGYADFLHTAVPILEEFGFSATVFVLPDLLGKASTWKHHVSPHIERELMDEDEVGEVVRRGFEVGSHYTHHALLTGVATKNLKEDLLRSRTDLEALIQDKVRGFCYPYGILDERVMHEVQEAGYDYACSLTQTVEQGRFDLTRVPIREDDDLRRFSLKMRFYFPYRKLKKLMRPGMPGDERLTEAR